MKACPHCGRVGFLAQHGFLWGYGNSNKREHKRGKRFWCKKRAPAQGCGQTFSVLLVEHIKGMMLSASTLEVFLEYLFGGFSIKAAWEKATRKFSLNSAYRIFSKFKQWLPSLRARLIRLCKPPDCQSDTAWKQTWLHLKKATDSEKPIEAFQLQLQKYFFSH